VDTHTKRERDPQDCTASPPLHVGSNGLVDDDGGAPMPRPGATCGVHPNRTDSTGPLGHGTGDVRPDKTGGVSPRRALPLDPRRGG
jgi:hypothetical protein